MIQPRTRWQRWVVDPLLAQLSRGITPRKLALTVAVGSACALFPVIGTTTVLCLLAAAVLKLNQPITQLINQLLWPLQVPVIFLCIGLGEKLSGATPIPLNIAQMNELLWSDPALFVQTFGTTLVYAIAGWLVLAPFWTAAVYFLTLPLTGRMEGMLKRADTKSAVAAPSGDQPI